MTKALQEPQELLLLEDFGGVEEENLKPLDYVGGFPVRPGFYEINGATAFPNGVNFTVITHSGTACELVLFHRQQSVPYAVIPFPEKYRIVSTVYPASFGWPGPGEMISARGFRLAIASGFMASLRSIFTGS